MFELARAYKNEGMTAYSRLQEKEFARESSHGYAAVKHQRFVGTGYFDQVATVVSSGTASTTALHGSTEEEQFAPSTPPLPVGETPRPELLVDSPPDANPIAAD
jgi:isocitrate lyase